MAQLNKTPGARACDAATAPSFQPQILILATQVADQASLMAAMMKAYAAMEALFASEQDALERSATRSALGSLMHALNVEMKRQVDALVKNTTALYACVVEEVGVG